MSGDKGEIVVGKIIETLPNAMYRVSLSNGETIIAYLGGRMKFNRIKVLIGDSVDVLLDPYGGKGRVVKRL